MQAISNLVLRFGVLELNECLVHAAVVNPHTLNWRGVLVLLFHSLVMWWYLMGSRYVSIRASKPL